MNKQDENELTENWHSDTNYLNEKIDDFFKRAQDHAYALGLARGMKEAAAVAEPDLLACDIKPRPLSHSLSDYHRAMSEGPLHYMWQDKPHRLVYDLIAAVRYYAAPVAVASPRKFTQATVRRKFEDGIQAQGWMVVGRGGSWGAAMKPLMQYLNGKEQA